LFKAKKEFFYSLLSRRSKSNFQGADVPQTKFSIILIHFMLSPVLDDFTHIYGILIPNMLKYVKAQCANEVSSLGSTLSDASGQQDHLVKK